MSLYRLGLTSTGVHVGNASQSSNLGFFVIGMGGLVLISLYLPRNTRRQGTRDMDNFFLGQVVAR